MEVWEDIKDYEGLYMVSNYGNVLSVRRNIILRWGINNNNYPFVVLYKNGNQKQYLVHRLVAQAFIPNPNNLSEVNHINENTLDPRVCNLEWCDRLYNTSHNYETWLEEFKKESNGVFHPIYCIEFSKLYRNPQTAGEALNIKPKNIINCCIGRNKSTKFNGIRLHWMYFLKEKDKMIDVVYTTNNY